MLYVSTSTEHSDVPGLMQDVDISPQKSGLVIASEERWLEQKGQVCKGQMKPHTGGKGGGSAPREEGPALGRWLAGLRQHCQGSPEQFQRDERGNFSVRGGMGEL